MKRSVGDIAGMQKGLKSAFEKVRQELDEHLETINQNSTEVQGVYEFLMVLEKKLEKLDERVGELQFLVKPVETVPVVDELTLREQEVFLLLYAADGALSVAEVASRLGFAEGPAARYVSSLLSKGVPLLRSVHEGVVAYSMELRFKDLQAKKSLVRIDERVSREIVREEML